MMDNEYEVPPLRVIRVRSNGKRDFDPRDKRQLVEACLRPGVSVSGMALNHSSTRLWHQRYRGRGYPTARRSNLNAAGRTLRM
ncbi:hypothetical protein [Cupriavidus basilensis]|uniref:hypothetical protein n=1 Tax=Cupriavidus basilensis TaxID=68895 RepID=UPI003204733C